MRKLSTDLIKSGSFTGSFSGSVIGTITSASFASTSSYLLNSFSLNTGSNYPITSSWSNNSITSSYSITSSNLSPVAQDLIPFTSSTYSLGSPTNKWKDLYVSTGSIYIGETVLSTSGSTLFANTSPVVTLNTASGQIEIIGITASLSASYAANVGLLNNTSSTIFATTGSNNFNGNQTVQGNITIVGSLTAQQYVVSSSISYFTSSNFDGSTKFGDTDSDTHQFTGSLRSPNITGSLFGTSSFSNNSTSASYSLTSSIALTALTSSYINTATNAVSSSYALTASFVANAGSSLTTGSTYPITSSWSNNSVSSSYANTAGTATSATSANTATSSSYATTAGSATSATSATSANTANSATSASYALTASYALNASEGGGGGSGTVTGSLNYIAKFTSVSTVSNSVIYETGSNIGIGTTVPNSKLNINSSGSLVSGSVVFSVEGTQGSLFSVDDNLSGSLMSVNDISGLPILEVFSDDRLVVGTYNSNALVVTGSRVGIGTNVPIAKLQVSGSISGSSFTSSVSNGVGFLGTSSFSVTSSYALSALTASFALNASGGGGGGSGTVTGSTNYISKFTSGTSVGNSVIYETGSNIGIGTTIPNSKLNINSSGSLVSGSVVFSVEGTQGSLFSVDDSLSGSLMSVNDISGLPILEVFSDDKLVVGTYNSNALVVTGSKVGIGTNNPIAKLQVNGNISGSSFTGSVFGTSSWATNALTASFASNAGSSLTTGSTYPITSSWANNSVSSSFSTTSATATSANTSNSATSASYSLSSSYSVNSTTSTSSSFASTASYVVNSISSSYALTASYALNAGSGGGGSSSSTSSLIGQTFVPTASVSQLSLTQSVSNNDQILVILDGLVQSRTGSYTVTGSTLNLTENADSGSIIDIRYLAGSDVSSSYATSASYLIDGSQILTADKTVEFSSSFTTTQMQALIDAQPKNLNGYSITFQFADGTYVLDTSLNFSYFTNGNIIIYGNSSNTSVVAAKNVTISGSLNSNVLQIVNNSAYVTVRYLRPVVRTTNYNTGINYSNSTGLIQYCSFTNHPVSTTSGTGHGVETSNNGTVTVNSSYFTSMDRYITANVNGKVLSSNNVQGTNSQAAYFAYGGIIHVFNTGLTGTTTYLTSVGGLIIRPSGTTVGT